MKNKEFDVETDITTTKITDITEVRIDDATPDLSDNDVDILNSNCGNFG